MDKLFFACEWARERDKSWSGTNLALFNELSKHFQLVDFNINGKSLKDKWYRFMFMFDMGKAKHKHCNKEFIRRFENIDAPIFQFTDYPNIDGADSFIYQDLSVCVLKELRENCKEAYKVSGFQNFSKYALNKREKIQSDFYFGKNCAGIFTMGKWLAKELIEKNKAPANKVYHVGGGYNLNPDLIDGSHKKGNKILFVGRDFERKNGPLVLEAFKLLYKDNSSYELYLAGQNKLNISHPNIHILGDLRPEELVDYFNLCDVFCMPSKFEAYGLVFPEALTFGLPCVGRDAFEMPYFIEEGVTGELLRSEKSEDLCALLKGVLNNTAMYKNVRNKRDFYLKEYSWDTVAKRIAAVIGEFYGTNQNSKTVY